jgi:hypothetical protein
VASVTAKENRVFCSHQRQEGRHHRHVGCVVAKRSITRCAAFSRKWCNIRDELDERRWCFYRTRLASPSYMKVIGLGPFMYPVFRRSTRKPAAAMSWSIGLLR